MNTKYLGNAWLREYYDLRNLELAKSCRVGSGARKSPVWEDELVAFPKTYAPKPAALEHVQFALKYDYLRLDLLKEVFLRIPVEEASQWVGQQPTGKWVRRVGFLYEFLTGRDLKPQSLGVGGNYVDLLDPEKYVVASDAQKVPEWRIENNLLGDREFCPVVRLTPQLKEGLNLNIESRLNELSSHYSPEIFKRAAGYLYQKETKSSYDIESEKPTPEKEERFVAALQDAGTAAIDDALSLKRLVELQNIIVAQPYAEPRYRDIQNYVGQNLPNYRQKIHYVPPPPQFVESLMAGLGGFLKKSRGASPIARAAITSFGFVFIHPFEDGNGRLHRFLIHDVLAMDRYIPRGSILPVSAWMLKNMGNYDRCLETFSKPLLKRIKYNLSDDDQLQVLNPDEVELDYRFPDMTAQVEYLATAIEGALTQELEPELIFLSVYDRARESLAAIVDMPDRRLDLLIKLLHQNRGRLSNSKRDKFSELTDAEIEAMSTKFREAFGITEQ